MTTVDERAPAIAGRERTDGRSARRFRGRLGVTAPELAVLAACAAFYGVFIARAGITIGGRSYFPLIDDAMISMDYARNLATGHGLVWHVGQHVEGYTNLLWTLWMAALHFLPFSEANAGIPVMVSGAAILLATMFVVRSICRLVVPERRFVPAVAMALVGLCYPLVFWTLRGMETGLAALLLALAVRLALGIRVEPTQRRLFALGAVLAAAALTRDDLLVPSVVIVVFAVWWAGEGNRRRALAIVGGLLVATVAAHTGFRIAYYGDALPNTYYLKLGGAPLGTRLHRGFVALTHTTLTSVYVAVALAVVCLLTAWRTRRFASLALLGAVFAIECLYSVYVGGDYAEEFAFANRFVVSAAPLLLVLAAVGASDVGARLGSVRARRAAVVVGAVVLVASAVLQGHGWSSTSMLEIYGPVPHAALRVTFALVAAAALAYLAIDIGRAGRWLRPVVPVALVLLTLAAVDYGAFRHWQKYPTEAPALERWVVQRALLVRQNTPPGASVAVVEAGDWTFFSHRPGVDLLGKVDRVVAHGPNHDVPFKPGHTKWNYVHSIEQLRPTIVTELFDPRARDLCNMVAWGYRQIEANFWVRSGAPGIDLARLSAGLRATDHRRNLPIPAACSGHA